MGSQPILCVRRANLERALGTPVPLGFSGDHELFSAVTSALTIHGEFRPRELLEEDPTYLQPIVYGVVTDGVRVLALWRKQRRATPGTFIETRHNRKIGLASGGHLELIDDLRRKEFFRAAMLRELTEELIFTPPLRAGDLQPLGTLLRDGAMFDRVHLGLIFGIPVRGTVALPQESDEYDDIRFLRLTELPPLRDAMEGWGQLLADAVLDGTISLAEMFADAQTARAGA